MATRDIDIDYKDGSKIFFTSDTHWKHEHIIGFCNRPFKDIKEMDDELVRLWNETVPEDGLVFHLGDFCWSRDWSIRNKLNGKIILIMGNHDFKNRPQSLEKFSSLFEHISQQMTIRIEGRKLLLNHYPMLCYAGTYRNKNDLVWQLHGHTHYGNLSTKGRDNDRLKICFPAQYDVGVDNNDFRPISWNELKEKINQQVESQTNYCGVNLEEINEWIK